MVLAPARGRCDDRPHRPARPATGGCDVRRGYRLLFALAAAGLAVGCGPSHPSAGPTPTVPATTTGPTSSSAAPTGSGTSSGAPIPTPTVVVPQACRSSELALTLGSGGAAAGSS